MFIFKKSLGNFCHVLEFKAAAKLWSDVMDHAANLLEVCGSLILLFEFQRSEVMSFGIYITEINGGPWSEVSMETMGQGRKGLLLPMAEGWGAWFPVGKPA